MDKKGEQIVKKKNEKEEEKAGFVPQYFEWVDIEKQKEIVEKLEKIE